MWISKKEYLELHDEIMTLRSEVVNIDTIKIDQDEIQKTAWRLVRSAHDRMGEGRGTEKLLWCIERLKKNYPAVGEDVEDYVRSAYVNFKIERGIK